MKVVSSDIQKFYVIISSHDCDKFNSPLAQVVEVAALVSSSPPSPLVAPDQNADGTYKHGPQFNVCM